MYNKKFKEQFLSNQEGTSVVPVYASLFSKSKEVEERVGKDMYNFNMQDIELLYYSVSTPSAKTLEVFHSLAVRYVNYAITQGQRESNVNLFENISFKELQKYVATYKHQFLTKNEFEEFMKYVANDVDVAVYRSLFEGINGAKYTELINLKHTDVYLKGDKYYVDLLEERASGVTKERTIEITSRLYFDLQKAYEQTEYLANNGETEPTPDYIEIVDSPFVFRPVKRGAYTLSDGKINMQTIYRKKILLNELTDGKIKSVNTIIQSGMLHYANEVYQKEGAFTNEDYLNIARKFNREIASQYESQKVKHVKNSLRQGLKERYSIEI